MAWLGVVCLEEVKVKFVVVVVVRCAHDAWHPMAGFHCGDDVGGSGCRRRVC